MKQMVTGDVVISYDVIGQGRPMLFVHGNGEDHSIFDRTADVLKEQFTCYLLDSRGHGKSSRVDALHYREMAEDVILFMEKLELEDVTCVGFSDGGIIGLMAAAKTARITTLIACGANLRPEGLKKWFRISMKIINVFRKDPLLALMLEEPDITDEELGRISADTLVLAGQHDLIRKTETDHIAEKIPRAEERILPHETHTSYVVHSRKLGDIIADYMERYCGGRENLQHDTYNE